jgi:murein L,D-transpeptidase YcbB/YkuD
MSRSPLVHGAIALMGVWQCATAAIAAPPPHKGIEASPMATPAWRTEQHTPPTLDSDAATLEWGNTTVELLSRTSQSPALQALIQAPTLATNFDQLGGNLSLEIDGTIVERGRKISTAAGLAVTLAKYFDQAAIPRTITIHSHGKPVFVSQLETTAQGTTMRSQLLNQPATRQTFQLSNQRSTARGVLGALGFIGLSPDRASTINQFIGDLTSAPQPQLAQHFTKLLLDLQGLSRDASPDRINALIASYNQIMKTADSDTINHLSRNPNFRALSSLLQNLSQSAAAQRATAQQQRQPAQLEAEAESGFVFTGLGAS